jgi:hypothetical protein
MQAKSLLHLRFLRGFLYYVSYWFFYRALYHLAHRSLYFDSSVRLPQFGTAQSICDCSVCLIIIRVDRKSKVLSIGSIRDLQLRLHCCGGSVDMFLERPFPAELQCSSRVSFPTPPFVQASTDVSFGYFQRVWFRSHPVRRCDFPSDSYNDLW